MTSSLLLKGGIALIHDEHDHVRPTVTDILISGNRIVKIEPAIKADATTKVIDCANKIVSPGFVDTHHHVWQTQLKGRHADDTLLEYVPKGALQHVNYTAEDVFWGELGGCLEAIDAGTTTVMDHAHMNFTANHSKMALAATISSGIRSIFGYSPPLTVESWKPLKMNMDILGGHVMDTFDELAKNAPFGNGRVQLGFGFDAWFLPKEHVIQLFERVKAAGVKRITSHYVRSAQLGLHSLPEIAHSYKLMDSSILWSHASNWTDSDVELFKKTGSTISSTASSELQMGHGLPIAYQDRAVELQTQIGIGIDCHSSAQGSIPAEMRLGLQAARAVRNEKFIEKDLAPVRVKPTVEEAFNFGTINGARALGMGEEIGSIQVGKLADLVVLDAMSPAMVCGAQHEPVAAVVLHSSPVDVDCVIIGGEVRKKGGKLVPVKVEEPAKSLLGKEMLEWKNVAEELVRSREQIQKRAEAIDYKQALEDVSKAFQLDLSRLVDDVPK